MNRRLNRLMMLSLYVALGLTQAQPTLASPIFADHSAGIFSLQDNAGPDVVPTRFTSATGFPFREVPSLSGRYAAGHMTILPYIGAGFGAGYNSPLDHAFTPNSQPQQTLNLGGLSGQSLVPNEFQLGIRIPF